METQEPVYKYKKDNPDYHKNRHLHLIELTKQRYKNDPEFKAKMLERSKLYYQKLRDALQEKEKNDIRL
jgi:hypothetical protein